MNGGSSQGAQSIGYRLTAGFFAFFPNGTDNPAVASVTGGVARFIQSITYSATGVQTIVFKDGFTFAQTPTFRVEAAIASLGEHYQAQVLGAYNATTRTLVVQQHRQGTGRVVPADAGAYITVTVLAHDTQGK